MRKIGTAKRVVIALGTSVLLVVGMLAGWRALRAGQATLSPELPFRRITVDPDSPSDVWGKGVGDLDGDGDLDLIAGGWESGGLSWYENPSWRKHVISSGSGFETDTEVCDLDGDGDHDVVSIVDRHIVAYRNPAWTSHLIAADAVHDIELIDLDGDGDCDLAARGQTEFRSTGNTLLIYEHAGDDSWLQTAIPVPEGEGLKAADLDGDGDADLIVNQNWLENTGGTDWVRHTFTTAWNHGDAFIDVGDFNGDGNLDIVHSPAELQGETYRVSWFEAPSDPRRPEWIEHVVADSVEAVLHFVGAGDFNNDGLIDLATAEMTQGRDPDEVRIYLNRGAGLDWDSRRIGVGGSHSMRVADIDGDGDLDLWGGNWNGKGVHIYLNELNGLSLDRWRRHVVDNQRPGQAVFIDAADLNGDSDPEIVTGGWWYRNPGTAGARWARRKIGGSLHNMALVGDLDGDGDIDILGTRGFGQEPDASFVWAENNGSGRFAAHDNIQKAEGDFLQGTARFDGPGSGSNVALSWHQPGHGVQRLQLPESPHRSTWTWSPISTLSQDEALSSGDIDGDGDDDLLLGTTWLEQQDTAWVPHTLHETASLPDRNRLVDLDRDGDLDALVGYEAVSTHGLLAWYEQGDDPEAPWREHVIASLIGPMSLDVRDLDHDGDLDVVVGEHNLKDPVSARLLLFENVDGCGRSWRSHLVHTGDEHHDGARLVDIDRDGDLDILSIGWGHSRVLLYENLAVEHPWWCRLIGCNRVRSP